MEDFINDVRKIGGVLLDSSEKGNKALLFRALIGDCPGDGIGELAITAKNVGVAGGECV
jgi:hypothetical protein